MDEQLRRRLVGAGVLFSLAVIFLPMLFDDGADKGRPVAVVDIPPRPQAAPVAPSVPLSPVPPAAPPVVPDPAPMLRDPSMEVLPNPPEAGTGGLVPTHPGTGPAPAPQTGPLYGPPPHEPPPRPTPAPAAPPPAAAQASAPKPEPRAPAAKPAPTPAATPASAPKPATPAATTSQPAAAPSATPSAPTPPAPRSGKAGWVVQVASLGSQGGAAAMVQELRSKGYPAFQEVVERDGKAIYRVNIGPQVDRGYASQIQEDLKGWLDGRNMKSHVRAYP